MRRAKLVALLVLVVLAVAGPAQAQGVFITRQQLSQWGIKMPLFRLMALSGNGQVLVGAEKEIDLKKRAAGLGYKLWMFSVSGASVKADHIDLPLAIWDQVAVNEQGTQAVVVGELGAKILEVDLTSKNIRTLMEFKKGVPGFRCDPRVVWRVNGEYYILGNFYNAAAASNRDCVAKIDLTKSGVAAFTQVLDRGLMEKKVTPSGWLGAINITERQAVYVTPAGTTQELIFWNWDGSTSDFGVPKSVLKLAGGLAFGTLAAAPNRALFSAKQPAQNSYSAFVVDIAQNKRWPIGKPGTPYQYGFISADGKTIAVSQINFTARKLNFYWGTEADNFQLKPVKALQGIEFGNFRFASSGNGWAWLDSTGIRIGRLP